MSSRLFKVGLFDEDPRQILCSDTILISKSDLAQTSSLSSRIKSLNPGAKLYNILHGKLQDGAGLDDILGLRAYSSFSLPSDAHEHDESCSHSHSHSITSMTLPIPLITSSAQFEKLDEWIRTVLWEDHIPVRGSPMTAGRTSTSRTSEPDRDKGESGAGEKKSIKVLRAKGLIIRSPGRKEWVLQGVQGLYDIFEVGEGAGDRGGASPEGGNQEDVEREGTKGKIVLIGNFVGVSEEEVGRSLMGWLA